MRRHGVRWFGWWYLCIAIGFFLLALNRALAGEKLFFVIVRLVISAGFSFLAWIELRQNTRQR